METQRLSGLPQNNQSMEQIPQPAILFSFEPLPIYISSQNTCDLMEHSRWPYNSGHWGSMKTCKEAKWTHLFYWFSTNLRNQYYSVPVSNSVSNSIKFKESSGQFVHSSNITSENRVLWVQWTRGWKRLHRAGAKGQFLKGGLGLIRPE